VSDSGRVAVADGTAATSAAVTFNWLAQFMVVFGWGVVLGAVVTYRVMKWALRS
jgi:hypothetical protein